MKQIIQILIVFLLFSCTKVGVSQIEINAVDKVLQFYGGQVNRAIGFKTSNGKKTDYFKLKVNKSQLLQNDQKYLAEHAGNIAYLFYSNLKKEKSNYDEIRVSIELENGESRNYNFPLSQLKEIESLYPIIEKTNEFINNEDYKSLANQFSDKIGTNENELHKIFDDLHSRFGNTKQIQFQGFSFEKDNAFGNYISIKEALVLDRNSGAMYLSFDPKTKQLIGINFP